MANLTQVCQVIFYSGLWYRINTVVNLSVNLKKCVDKCAHICYVLGTGAN